MADKRAVFAINWAEVDALVAGRHDNPHHILGMHETTDGVYINAYYPGADKVVAVKNNSKQKFELISDRVPGFFTIKIPDEKCFVYFYKVTYPDGKKYDFIDPYSFEPVIDPIDISRFNDGVHYEIYEKLGAHPCMLDGVQGVLFAVWAPRATRVSVVGNFNKWDGRVHTMRRIEYSGLFELFIPGLKAGELYKYEILNSNGSVFMKPDPYGNACELRPGNASMVADLSYEWKDAEYMNALSSEISQDKKVAKQELPMNIYEVHLGSFKRPKDGREFFTYREIAKELAKYVADMGYTHVELMPVMEHENDSSFGYQTSSFYAPTSRYGTPADFMYFVDYMHSKGIGVICDWVPSQFPMNESGLAKFDGQSLYEPEDLRRSENPRWGTYIFDYGRKEVRNYLICNALYWVSKYHLDGLRIDSVASMLYLDYGRSYGNWIPNQYGGNENLDAIAFLKDLNTIINERFPYCMMICEEESGWPMLTNDVDEGGMGFDYQWNTSWMRTLLSYMSLDPLYRRYEHKKLVDSLGTAYDENYILEFSHNEVINGKGSIVDKMPGGYEEKFSNLRLLYGCMMTHPGKKLLAMGQEFAQFKEFSENGELEWDLLDFDAHTILRGYVKALNHFYKNEPALYALGNNTEGFEWINDSAANDSVVSFLRKTGKKEDTLLIVCNFTPVTHEDYKVGVPHVGNYKEIFSSELTKFGGDGSVNPHVRASRRSMCDGRRNSIFINLAPLSMSIFKLTDEEAVPYEEPKKEKKAPVKKTVAKKTATKKTTKTANKTVTKKTVAKKTVAKKSATKKANPSK
ncbi:MAG: 1,4-alpha-glucan branching protein GlgB [Lachnospiraceae bacterium]|nr:1,4-alpha-glucan branching protein GlgB [Lachnospiraceae bacterium]